jgi:hypothetical protein
MKEQISLIDKNPTTLPFVVTQQLKERNNLPQILKVQNEQN